MGILRTWSSCVWKHLCGRKTFR